MNKELQQVIEYNNDLEREKWSRFAAAMVFWSAILYFLLH